MMTRLLQVYPLFSKFFTLARSLLQDPVLSALTGKTTGMIAAEIIVLETRKDIPWTGLYSILDRIPDSDCAQLGIKIGSSLRFVGRFSLPAVEI